MLQQALQAAANNMQATGQTVQSSLSGQNQNLQQAAQGVVGGTNIYFDQIVIINKIRNRCPGPSC